VTVMDLLRQPAALVAVSVQVVVALGKMDLFPTGATSPIPGLMFTLSAPVPCQLSVAKPPAVILVGLTETPVGRPRQTAALRLAGYLRLFNHLL